MPETILEMKSITKRFAGVLALDGASLELRRGEVHILLGENGAGKSTLVKVLAGAYQSDEGEMVLAGRKVRSLGPKHAQDLGISAIYQEFNLIPHLTVAQNIFLGREPASRLVPAKIDHQETRKKAAALLSELKVAIDPDAKVAELGVAAMQMVEIAKALSNESSIVIMDEPTAALTENEIDNLFRIILDIKGRGVSIIYISHRLEEFERIGDRVTIMRDGRTIETVDARTTPLEAMIRSMVGRDLTDKFPPRSAKLGAVRLAVRSLSRRGAFKDISFSVRAGEIVGFSGLMGAGRTEIMRAVFGVDPLDSGEMIVDGKEVRVRGPRDAIAAGLGFVTENRRDEGLVLSLGVGRNISLASLDSMARFWGLDRKREASMVDGFMRRLRIKCFGQSQGAGTLSGGNQQKAVLAKWLMSGAGVFILDEPTRGIDVGAKVEVYGLMNELAAQGAAIVMVSSELPEVIGMSDRVYVVCRGEIAAELPRGEATQERIMHYAIGGGRLHD